MGGRLKVNNIIRLGIANVNKLQKELNNASSDSEILELHHRLHNMMYCVIHEFTKAYGNRKGEGGSSELDS